MNEWNTSPLLLALQPIFLQFWDRPFHSRVPELSCLYPLPVLTSIVITWSTATLRKLQTGQPSLQSRGAVWPTVHHAAPETPSIQRFWFLDRGESLRSLTISAAKHTSGASCRRTQFWFVCCCFFQCSRLNYYSQREPFISSDTAGSFLGKQLYCCERLTQTVVICNKDKKIALVS